MRRVPAQNLRPLLATALLVALLVPGTLAAQEVIVKNDSVTDFSTAVIVGDFVPGEEAGTVLTMPQSGTIVGVQIFWRSGGGVSGYSIENAIHIYDGSTFPTPGTELETVVAPVLEELAAEYSGKVVIAKVNTDQDSLNALKLGVQGIPTMVLFKDGQEIDRVVGALPKTPLKQWIDSAISN